MKKSLHSFEKVDVNFFRKKGGAKNEPLEQRKQNSKGMGLLTCWRCDAPNEALDAPERM